MHNMAVESVKACISRAWSVISAEAIGGALGW